MIFPVILSGGSGTRLWPVSREALPKQLLPLISDRSMLQETALRTHGVDGIEAPLVICNQEHRFLVAEQMLEIGINPSAILLEPVGRNTAPAVAVAALWALTKSEDACIVVLAADHLIQDVEVFREAMRNAAGIAKSGELVTFGIIPETAETGYGYIKRGAEIVNTKGFKVERFVEKPNKADAEKMISEGGYYWNSGMFVLGARSYLNELEKFRPDILEAAKKAFDSGKVDLDFVRLDKDAFVACPSESIDYAVMEKTSHAALIPVSMGWNDIGSWSAVWDVSIKDDRNNVMIGDVVLSDVDGCLVRSERRMVAALGVKDLVIIETDDAVMVADLSRAQDVKNIVSSLKLKKRSEALHHKRVYRPWGYYESIDTGDRFQVKRIMVKPGEKLSLQKHHHRAEHWIVVSGTANVICGEQQILLAENQSTYIPMGEVHRLENPGKIPLHLIEVQSGSYLGEDDIVRFEDVYSRS